MSAKEMTTLQRPRLSCYWPSEQRAIIVHKYFLGIERGTDPSIEDAIESWEERHAHDWRCAKMRRDAEAQLAQIDAHRDRMSRDLNRPVSFSEAARDWVHNYESNWRTRWEQTELAGA